MTSLWDLAEGYANYQRAQGMAVLLVIGIFIGAGVLIGLTFLIERLVVVMIETAVELLLYVLVNAEPIAFGALIVTGYFVFRRNDDDG